MKTFKIEVEGKEIEFQVKNWVKRSSGEVVVKSGQTQVLVTVVMEDNESDFPYFPLTVNYEEKYYARGKILGSRFVRRETRPSINAILIARMIDRTVRPLFPEGMRNDIQIIATCLSWDKENDPGLLGLLGASFVLNNSVIPWEGPIGAVRISQSKGKLLVNPTSAERKESEMEILFCGVQKDKEPIINMIEMEGAEIKEEEITRAAEKALEIIRSLCEFQEKIREEIGKEKRALEKNSFLEIEKEVESFIGNKIEKILFSEQRGLEDNIRKAKELESLKNDLKEKLENKLQNEENKLRAKKLRYANDLLEKIIDNTVHEKAIQGKRIDNRKLDEVRKIQCEVGPIPQTHGSAIFSRGLTTSLSIVTLGGPEDQKLIEEMEIAGKKRFLHHYNFPPYSVGEARPLRGPGRREFGHGMLGEKALRAVIPDFDSFPYTIRVVSEMLTSNGSTSQSAICSSSLALMDAGVPIKRPVAGIAIGLAQKGENYRLLTDIQGPEDSHGGMDFKVAGTTIGVCAIQMDVKVRGITLEILKQALEQGKKARLEIIKAMEKEIPEPRKELSSGVPRVAKIIIPKEKIGLVIGSGGQTIQKITQESGAEITIEEENNNGSVYITGPDDNSLENALRQVKSIVREIETGDTFLGEVVKVMPFGVFVALRPGKDGLLHSSKYKKKFKPGDMVKVKVESIKNGKLGLAMQ